METLQTIRLMLDQRDEANDDQLKAILNLTQARLLVLLGAQTVPEELSYILVEVAIKRFNRIGSEGVASHSIEGESMTFTDDDFAPFEDDMQAWRSKQHDQKKGRVRFL
ncbi:phage head-tail connector protein [uncultured Dubosiella sp.]|uniref:phage head-tail connector protein n=1 Tax=uncultured Dubosiella sp. TaxID=1937011 RepID=UPI002731DD75|nr:phage head-tail connector protein [uncultured Dubosiella sp.]